MRFGCCIGMNAEDVLGEKKIRYLAEAGYDYFEAALVDLVKLTGEQIERLLAISQETGIACEAANVFFPGTLRLTGENVDRAKFEAYVTSSLAVAGRIGVQSLVLGSSGAKNIPEGFPYERAYEQLVEELRFIDKEAAKNGVTVVIEPLNRRESNLIVSLKEGHELVHAAEFTNIRLLVDLFHFCRENDDPQWIVDYKEDLRHVHIANPGDRRYPTGPLPEFDWFFAKLKEAGYDSRISVEANMKNFEADAKAFIENVKHYYW
ncbi:MAG: sugar phosphate isomerase/epimerase [Lachnospiraceae bacterium]|nr:sugar phosphate isomerase/epimerase [Lachnospiraceae bacterium]